MSILMYVPRDNEAGEHLLRQFNDFIEDGEMEVIRLLASFTSRLRRPLGSHDIAVLMPPDENSLAWLYELYLDNLMNNLRLVIILPEQRDELLNIAHCMFPRYLTDIHSDFSDVKAVLYNLLIHSCLNKLHFH
ncbi:MAG: hypothetical protein ACKVE4_11900 [Dissulfuribacterales bacterium]